MKRILLVLALSAAAAAAVPASGQALVFSKNATKWPGGVVPVCFRSGSSGTGFPGFGTMKPTIQKTVNNSWARYARLQFVGFATCPSSSPAGTVDIRFTPGTAQSRLGYFSGSGTDMQLDPNDKGARFTTQVLHEFGHALGFEHEMDRKDNTDPVCWGRDLGGDLLTPFDLASVMAWSYCPSRGDGPISPWDIVGVQNAYGRKSTGSLVGLNNYCLDIPGASWAVGIELQVYTCNGTSSQSFIRSNGTLQAKPSGVTRCVDAGDTDPYPSRTPISNSCYGGSPGAPGELFGFTQEEIRGLGDKCLQIVDTSFSDGTFTYVGTYSRAPVELYDCNSSARQAWRIEKDGTIKNAAGAYCLDVPNNAPSAGLRLWMYACNGTAAQRFTFTPAGEIRFSGYCLDSVGATPANGARIQLWYCKTDDRSRRNQQFHLRGWVDSVGGSCLRVAGDNPFDGAKAEVGFSCYAKATSTWDYYF